MSDSDTKHVWQDDMAFRLLWRDTVSTIEAMPNSLVAELDLEYVQLLDQFAAWINEGGAGREPSR